MATEENAASLTCGTRVILGLKEVVWVSLPLIISHSGTAVKVFTDRVMLSRYSQESLSAVLPAGVTMFTLIGLFVGITGYVNTFVAQYVGANRPERVGLAIWQGVFVALLGGALMATGIYWADWLFGLFGHAPQVQVEQVRYFRILAGASVLPMLTFALSSFWNGRGKTWVVMAVQLFAVAVNIALNYGLIFGNWGLPELGIVGAAWGTVAAELLALGLYTVMILSPANRAAFHTWPARKLDWALLQRLIRFGFPNGVHFVLDIGAFSFFVIIIGRMGTVAQEAATIALSLNLFSFFPLSGLGMGVGILVGQAVGAQQIPRARAAVRIGLTLALVYMGAMALILLTTPEPILRLFMRPNDTAQATTLGLARVFLYYIAAYLVFDAMYVIYHQAIKGAGDTRFAMLMSLTLSWFGLVLPSCWVYRAGGGIHHLWGIFVAYISVSGLVFYLRYRSGKWETMQVIER